MTKAKRILTAVVLCGTATAFLKTGAAQAPPQSTSASGAPRAVSSGTFPVKVIKTLDSSKLKGGESVELETASSFKLADGTLVTKGSKLTGHVTAAKSRSKGDTDSELAVSFDKLIVSGGKDLSIKGTIQAVFPPVEEAAPQMAGAASNAAGGGMASGSVGTMTNAKSGSANESSPTSQSGLDPKAMGVQGIHDLHLENGVLTSKGKNVKLGSGVRMIVRVDILG